MSITTSTIALALSFAGAISSSIPAQSASTDTLRFTFLSAGRPSGEMKTWTGSGGEWHTFFEFNDRGRGPRLHTLMYGAVGLRQ